MPRFIPLQNLRDRVWSLAVRQRLATDMTGVSLPILDFTPGPPAHPYRVIFLLYYAVPTGNDPAAPSEITRAYAQMVLDLGSSEVVEVKSLHPPDQPNPLKGKGVSDEVLQMSAEERSTMQYLFFNLYDHVAKIYAGDEATSKHAEIISDFLNLFPRLLEPPLVPDYEMVGQSFLTWLRNWAER